MKNPWVIIGVITVVLFGGAIFLSGMSAEKNNEGVEIIQHIKGNPDASIVLTEYSDLQCPACAAFLPVVNEVMSEYGDSIRFEYKHFPLPTNQHAISASMAAEAAGQQGKFFEYHDLLFESQQVWSTNANPEVIFLQYADTLGLDVPTFKRHMNSSLLRDKVRDEFSEGRQLGVSGTPSFFLNGQRMEFQTYQEFIQQIAFAVDPSSVPTSTPTQNGAPSVRFGI
tara:strand:- start:4313 stop:4987 length:675 start_codon:yes stop_codon:yes gene_type:complete